MISLKLVRISLAKVFLLQIILPQKKLPTYLDKYLTKPFLPQNFRFVFRIFTSPPLEVNLILMFWLPSFCDNFSTRQLVSLSTLCQFPIDIKQFSHECFTSFFVPFRSKCVYLLCLRIFLGTNINKRQWYLLSTSKLRDGKENVNKRLFEGWI